MWRTAQYTAKNRVFFHFFQKFWLCDVTQPQASGRSDVIYVFFFRVPHDLPKSTNRIYSFEVLFENGYFYVKITGYVEKIKYDKIKVTIFLQTLYLGYLEKSNPGTYNFYYHCRPNFWSSIHFWYWFTLIWPGRLLKRQFTAKNRLFCKKTPKCAVDFFIPRARNKMYQYHINII